MNIKITADEKGTQDTGLIFTVLYCTLYYIKYIIVQYSTFTNNTLQTISNTAHTLYNREHTLDNIVSTLYNKVNILYIIIQTLQIKIYQLYSQWKITIECNICMLYNTILFMVTIHGCNV